MTDERIVEVIAKGIANDRAEYPVDSGTFDDARAGLAALRGAGFDIYRPDDCPTAQQLTGKAHDARWLLIPADDLVIEDEHGTQTHVVPVGGDS